MSDVAEAKTRFRLAAELARSSSRSYRFHSRQCHSTTTIFLEMNPRMISPSSLLRAKAISNGRGSKASL